MPETIVVRWGCKSAASGSRFRVRRSLDYETWTELAAAQPATAPYASPTAVLAIDTAYGAASVLMVDASGLSASGYLWLDEALVQWTGKSTNTLTGCAWHSGRGTYAAGTEAVQAHESYTDSGVTPTNEAVVYQVTHIDPTDKESSPAEIWYYYPNIPVTSRHCRLLVVLGYDVGGGMQSNVEVHCKLASDDQFLRTGPHLDQDVSPLNTVRTNSLGLAGFDVVKNPDRWAKGRGEATGYVLTLNRSQGPQTIQVPDTGDRDYLVVGADVGE